MTNEGFQGWTRQKKAVKHGGDVGDFLGNTKCVMLIKFWERRDLKSRDRLIQNKHCDAVGALEMREERSGPGKLNS